MKTIHLDAVGGIAGDMFVAALLDALPDLVERVLADGRAVLPVEAGGIRFEAGHVDTIAARRFGLKTRAGKRRELERAPAAEHSHAGHHHDHHQHHHDHHNHDHPDEHRKDDSAHTHDDAGTFRDMVARIEAARLHPGTAAHAVAILTILAEAESGIHGVPVEDVHFHEIADWDSLLDVVAAGSVAAALEGTRWTVSALPRGGGLVHTRHGLLPVPAPATAAILAGFEWRDDGVSGERVTPTGAAILRHLVDPGNALAGGRLQASGAGAGTRTLPGIPNICRALVFENDGATLTDSVAVVEFEVDDMTGEEIGVACERLRANVLRREAGVVGGLAVKTVDRPGGRTMKAESDALRGDSLTERRALKRRAEEDSHG